MASMAPGKCLLKKKTKSRKAKAWLYVFQS
jgi:hypothetical protein